MFTEDYNYKDGNGTDLKMVVKPLPTKFISILWDVQKKLSSIGITPKEKEAYAKLEKGHELSDEESSLIVKKEQLIMNSLEASDIEKLLNLCEATVKKSVPTMKQEEVEEFLSLNFWSFYPVVLNLNLSKK